MRLRRFCSLALAFVVICCAVSSVSAYAASINCFQCGDLLVPVIPEKFTSEGVKYACYLFAWGEEGKLGLCYRSADSLTLNENGLLKSSMTNVYICSLGVNDRATTDYYKGYWSSCPDAYTNGRVVLWSSVDVYNADGSLYMAGSDPIPTRIDTPVVYSDIQPVLGAFGDQINVPLLIGILAGAAGVGVVFVFLWWAVRKSSGMLMKAFRKGKLRI